MKYTKLKKATEIALACTYQTKTTKSARLTDDGWLRGVDVNLKELTKLLPQTQQETLEWVLKEVIGEDEEVIELKDTPETEFLRKPSGQGRNDFRNKQRQTIKKKMEGKG